MSGLSKKIIQLIIKVLLVPAIVTIAVWEGFQIAGGEIIKIYEGPSIFGWLARVYTAFDFGLAGEWTSSGEKVIPYLWYAIGRTGAITLLAITIVTISSLVWTNLVWRYPYNRTTNAISIIIRFFSSWPILIGAIIMAVVSRGMALSSIILPALVLAICDNNLNDFKDNLVDDINNVLKSDYAIATRGQGRSFIKNLAPELSWKVLSYIASRLPALISGIIILELYFNIKGIYVFLDMFYKARDLNAILGITFLVSLLLTAWSSLFAIVHALIDPRQRY
jgi:ABC-type dipeptide/oligopeptide/nickel transport system permease component